MRRFYFRNLPVLLPVLLSFVSPIALPLGIGLCTLLLPHSTSAWEAEAGAPSDPKQLLTVDDLYRLEGPRQAVLSPDQQRLAYIRRWVDQDTREERFSLWLVEQPSDGGRPLEAGEPDARTVTFSPDGKWLAIRSTRPRPDRWQATPSVPPESEPATDIWLVPTEGGVAIPLAGPEKPYGRVFHDPFYGGVTFSPDGRYLAFVADDGKDPRTAEEIESNVIIVRPDQGEGYTGYETAQVWLAELDPQPERQAARSIRRLTDDEIWYGDPQWTPDGNFLICHANKSGDVESVRYSINKNFDLWAIDVATTEQQQLTTGIGPEVSPRVSPDGQKILCLSSPRQGPHADVFQLLVIERDESGGAKSARVLHDHHLPELEDPEQRDPPHPIPAFPLPDDCWIDDETIRYSSAQGTATITVQLDLNTAVGVPWSNRPEEDEQERESRRAYRERLRRQAELTPAGNRLLRERIIAEEQIFTWCHEDLELEGVLTIPPPQVGSAPYPLVVYPHGGPHSRSARGFNFTAQILAANGYLVFQPNFRGSAGYGRLFLDADRYDLGGGDMDDILTGIRALVEQDWVQPERQFLHGSSYGGFMTTWLVGHTEQFAAAVAQNAVTDMYAMWGLSDLQSWTEWELGGRPWEIPLAMRRHSPIMYVDRVVTPTLVLHAREDRRVPIAMGKMFYQSLLARGVPTQMVIYPDEGHGIREPRHQTDVLRRILAWFAEHDPGVSSP
jgi:dipeptidyl aminopeptidase/acylaminoacyl peptidase